MIDYAKKNYHRRTNWPVTIAAVIACGSAWIYLIYLCVEELAR